MQINRQTEAFYTTIYMLCEPEKKESKVCGSDIMTVTDWEPDDAQYYTRNGPFVIFGGS